MDSRVLCVALALTLLQRVRAEAIASPIPEDMELLSNSSF